MQSTPAPGVVQAAPAPPPLAVLTSTPQWILVNLRPGANGKTDKIPCHFVTGEACNAHEPANWAPYDAVRQLAECRGAGWTVGFVITAADPFFCLDIDHARLPDGSWSPLAQKLVAALPGCMVEISQSGQGLHVWGRYPNPPAHASKRIELGIELYTEKRFIAFGTNQTGEIAPVCEALPAFIAQYFPPRAVGPGVGHGEGPRPDWRGPTDDDELLRRALRSTSAGAAFSGKATFADLWGNNVAVLARCYPGDSEDGVDRSSADAALAQHLAFWTGCDQQRIIDLMMRSSLRREKYEREDYLPRTVAQACAQQRDVLQDKPVIAEAPGGPVAAVPPPSSSVTLLRADTVPLEPVRWLWPGFLPAGMLTILGGAPGCGKTTIALAFGAAVSAGRPWPDGSPCGAPGDVLMWSGEDLPSILAARLAAMDADRARVHFVGDVAEGFARRAFDPGRDMTALEGAARSLAAPRLLIIDPIVSAVAGDSHKNAEVRRALQPVVDLAQRLGCAVLGITHFTKGTAGRDPTERITGSLAFGALARVVLAAAKVRRNLEEDARRVFVRAKSNIGPDDGGFAYELEQVDLGADVKGQRVKWLEALDGTALEVLAEDDKTDRAPTPRTAALVAFVHDKLSAGPAESDAWKKEAEQAGFPWRKVTDEAKRRGARSSKRGMTGGFFWVISDQDEWTRTCPTAHWRPQPAQVQQVQQLPQG